MSKNFSNNIATLLALFLGVTFGWLDFSIISSGAEAIAELFLRLFRLIAPPIIFLSLASSLSSMKGMDEVKKMGGRLLFYTFNTTIVATLISLFLFFTLQPVTNIAIESHSLTTTGSGVSYLSFLTTIVPENFVNAFLTNNIVGIALLGAAAGLCTQQLQQEQKSALEDFFSALYALILKFTEYLLMVMPIAIWAFTLGFVRELSSGGRGVGDLLLYSGCILGSNLLQGIVVLPFLLIIKGFSPYRIFRGMTPALMTAFFSKSSNAALPLSMRCATENLGISHKTAQVSFPLCSVINMNGCASFILTTVLFVSMSQGVTFSALDLFFWIFLATFAAIGNAGVPMGCFFLSSAFLTGMDLSLEMMGLILPLYAFFDMVETALNVWSDSVITVIVDRELKT